VADFNFGARSGDWSLMLERFADDAELVLPGRPGPIEGVSAIRSAYLERPPGDEIVVLDAWETADGVSGTYAWGRAPEGRAGEIALTVDAGRVTRLVVSDA
jgi:hypothetical protein